MLKLILQVASLMKNLKDKTADEDPPRKMKICLIQIQLMLLVPKFKEDKQQHRKRKKQQQQKLTKKKYKKHRLLQNNLQHQ